MGLELAAEEGEVQDGGVEEGVEVGEQKVGGTVEEVFVQGLEFVVF